MTWSRAALSPEESSAWAVGEEEVTPSTRSCVPSRQRRSLLRNKGHHLLDVLQCSLRAPQSSGDAGLSLSCPGVRLADLNWYVLHPHKPPSCAAKFRQREILGTRCSDTGVPVVVK